MAEPATLRLFVACDLADGLRSALAGLQEALRRQGAERLRWVRPEGIHITLKFLGDVEQERLPELTSALADAIEPFELRLRPGELGGFGGSRLRVVWVGLDGDIGPLATLAGCVEGALEPLGFARERRPFAPHLTLARVPDRASQADRHALAALLERFETPALPEMALRQVALIRSTLTPSGAVYETLASFPAAET